MLNRLSSEEKSNNKNLHRYSRVLIIDSMNLFTRMFSAVNSHNQTVSHVGGLCGFLKGMSAAIKLINPTECILVFDGEQGSRNRKYLYPQYKANRIGNNKISNYKSFRTKHKEDTAKFNEMTRLIDYLAFLPVKSVCVDKLEADDVIGYLATKFYTDYEDSEVYIMSTDQDFLQLVNDRITVWSPTKKKFFKPVDVLETYNVHPENFPIYKALVGDTSDNVPGVDGFGEKNAPKLVEFLTESKRHTLNDLYELCENPPKNSVLYNRVLEIKPIVEIFYKIMNIQEPNISDIDLEDIINQVYIDTPRLKRNDFIRLTNEDQLGSAFLYIDSFLESFSLLNLK